MGVEVVSSGDLIQQFEAHWNDAAIATHRAASEKLYRIKDQAFDEVARRLRDGVPTTEYDIQQKMVGWFKDEGLIADSAPCVSAQENAGNPHYLATAAEHRVDPQGRAGAARSVGQARSSPARCMPTSRGWDSPGTTVPEKMTKAFAAIAGARDAAVSARAGRGGAPAARSAASKPTRPRARC